MGSEDKVWRGTGRVTSAAAGSTRHSASLPLLLVLVLLLLLLVFLVLLVRGRSLTEEVWHLHGSLLVEGPGPLVQINRLLLHHHARLLLHDDWRLQRSLLSLWNDEAGGR